MRGLLKPVGLLLLAVFTGACMDNPQAPSAFSEPVQFLASVGSAAPVCHTLTFDEFGHGDPVSTVASGFGFDIGVSVVPAVVMESGVNVSRSDDWATVYDTDLPNGPDRDLQWHGPDPACADCNGLKSVLVIPDVDWEEDWGGDSQDGGTIHLSGFAGYGSFFVTSFKALDQDDDENSIRLSVDGVDVGGSSGLGNGSVETVSPTTTTFETAASFLLSGSGGVDDVVLCQEQYYDVGECDGKVTQLTLKYHGSVGAEIMVTGKSKGKKKKKKKNGDSGSTSDDGAWFYKGTVEPSGTFTVIGNDKKGTMGTEITIWVGGVEHTRIHTSCSRPIGPGLVSGDFEVVSGFSLNGGALPPLP